jgi:membrane associated rhomboid family serine protease
MPNCPICSTPLRTIRQREGVCFFCEQCNGRAVTVPQIRRVAGDQFATQLLRQINRATDPSSRVCPFCSGHMRQFSIRDPPLVLDSCRTCGVVWFDPQEFEAVPEGAIEAPDQLVLRGREAFAVEKVRQIREQAEADDVMPDEKWKWVAAFVGMPVKLDEERVSQTPWLTWSLSAVIALISILALFHFDYAVAHFALVPSRPWRYGGVTFISSFFLHVGLWHLVSNLYFFFVFGENVEDYLGRWKFLLLLSLATIAGDVLYVLFEPRSDMPSVGASGGIAGVLAFYALEFPRARLAFFIRFAWIKIPAWGAFVLWVFLQIITAFLQVNGAGTVSGLAHLGGAVAGFFCWLKWGNTLTLFQKHPAN